MEDALLPPKRQVARSNRAEPTTSFNHLRSAKGLVYRPCPYKCPHGTGFFSPSPSRIYSRGRLSAGPRDCAGVPSVTPQGQLQRVGHDGENRSIEVGDTAQGGLGELAGHLCLATEAETVGGPGFAPPPRFFSFSRFRHSGSYSSAQGKLVPRASQREWPRAKDIHGLSSTTGHPGEA